MPGHFVTELQEEMTTDDLNSYNVAKMDNAVDAGCDRNFRRRTSCCGEKVVETAHGRRRQQPTMHLIAYARRSEAYLSAVR